MSLGTQAACMKLVITLGGDVSRELWGQKTYLLALVIEFRCQNENGASKPFSEGCSIVTCRPKDEHFKPKWQLLHD